MSKNVKIAVSEAHIDDDLIQQHQIQTTPISNNKSITIKMPKLPKLRASKPNLSKFSTFRIILVVVIVAGAVGAGLYQNHRLNNLKKENKLLANSQAAAEDEVNQVKNQVGRLIELPGETPTVATIVDIDKLKSQPFFANAQNGDKVLIFTNAKKAVLYRPGTNKIVEVAPINGGDTSAGVAGQSTTDTTSPLQSTPTNRQ